MLQLFLCLHWFAVHSHTQHKRLVLSFKVLHDLFPVSFSPPFSPGPCLWFSTTTTTTTPLYCPKGLWGPKRLVFFSSRIPCTWNQTTECSVSPRQLSDWEAPHPCYPASHAVLKAQARQPTNCSLLTKPVATYE